MSFWIVWDSCVQDVAPDLLPTWQGERRAQAFADHPSFTTAQKLDDLAQIAGIDADGLARSIAEYNAALTADAPDPLGRTHRPLALTTGS